MTTIPTLKESQTKGSKPGFALVLHTHIPWVLGHGNWPHGAVWLYEAAAETYIPLLDALNRLSDDGLRAGATIGITPVLAEQLTHPAFAPGFNEYLKVKIEAAIDDGRNFSKQSEDHYAYLADFWRSFYQDISNSFNERYNRDLVRGFRDLQDKGMIEIITSCATHGYLPLISNDPSVRAQVQTGVDVYRRHFGRDPVGFWLPECAYRPAYKWISPTDPECEPLDRVGVESILAEAEIRYFMVDTALLKGGKSVGVYLARFEGLRKLWEQFESEARIRPEREDLSPHRVYSVGGDSSQPVAVLTRDPQTGMQVWSGKHGYPGDGNYLEFHKKHFPGGHRYWRVTQADVDLHQKEPYYPEHVDSRVAENADHFVGLVEKSLQMEVAGSNSTAILCAPYDTELFGHWWFEGVKWLEQVWRKLAHSDVQPITGSEALERAGSVSSISLPEGSWGEGGFHQIWFNPDTEWCWKLIHNAESVMVDRVERFTSDERDTVRELLEAMGRELLLLQASDWTFVITTGSAPDYAEQRLRDHYSTFETLRRLLDKVTDGNDMDDEDKAELQRIRHSASLFHSIDTSLWKAE